MENEAYDDARIDSRQMCNECNYWLILFFFFTEAEEHRLKSWFGSIIWKKDLNRGEIRIIILAATAAYLNNNLVD